MENQRTESRRTAADGIRLGLRALVHTVLGGAALLAIATVTSVLGPLPALDLSCCTADATTVKAEVRGVEAPPVDSWVPAVTPGAAEAWPPVVDATSPLRVRQPDNPYEKR
ncbi:hypothetical protein AB0D62_29495 [Streptomyces massasporeus]|uniref:hypothetical protein n=1 Tax=Streptomyces massasporeus TaxID=67324 RepID=UPI00340A427D